jgi:hypothetical protein
MPGTGNATTPADPLVTRMAKDEGRPRNARCGNQSWRVLRLQSHHWQTMAKPRSLGADHRPRGRPSHYTMARQTSVRAIRTAAQNIQDMGRRLSYS